MTRSDLPPAVVFGLSPTGLYAIRELGRAGVPVYAVGDAVAAASASKYVIDTLIDADPQRRLDWLFQTFPENGPRPVLIATSDQDVDFIIAHGDVLAQRFVIQRSYLDGLAGQIMTKESFYALCESHGVAYPGLWEADATALAGLRDQIAYPCMIKPSRIHDIKAEMAGRKGWIVRDATELDATLPGIPAHGGVMLVQEIVPGPESNITLYCGYFDGQGGVQQGFTCRKLRQYPPGFGSASLVQSHDEAETRQIAETFLKALNYQGIAGVEFKRDPGSGQLKIIEINVRPSLWFSISTAAGRRATLAEYYHLAQTGTRIPEHPQLQGVRWRYGMKDLYSAMFYRRKSDFILPRPDIEVCGPAIQKIGAVLTRDDPAPMIAELTNLLRKAVRRIAK